MIFVTLFFIIKYYVFEHNMITSLLLFDMNYNLVTINMFVFPPPVISDLPPDSQIVVFELRINFLLKYTMVNIKSTGY